MKHIKKFNESKQQIKGKDLQETIDQILDNLSSKKQLSESEKEFLTAASKNGVKSVTEPHMTDDFWANISNPHNIGIMWVGDDGIWKRLMTVEEEEDEYLDKIKDADERFNRKKQLEIERYLGSIHGLKKDLEQLLDMELKVKQKADEIYKKYKEPGSHHFNMKLEYATNGTLHSLINQFGWEDDDGNYYIGTKK